MKLLVVSSILILSRNVVTFGSSIRVSELEGNEEEQQRQQMNRKLEVTNLFADTSKNGDGSNNKGQVRPKRDVALTMASSKTEYAANESVAIDITLKNTDATKSARILSWINPCNGADDGDTSSKSSPVDMSFLDVKTVGGQSALYLGALIKRKEPTDKDYKILKAGEQILCTINLDKYFQFDSPSGDDEYTISYSVTSMQLSQPFKTQGTNAIESLETNALSLKINARTNISRSLREKHMRGLQAGGTTFNKCTTSQQGFLREARTKALAESANAVSNITSISLWRDTTTCSRYNTWFGPFENNRFTELKQGYEAISARLNDATILFDCGCTDSSYAYVYPSQPYGIYLCQSFWAAPMDGTDSKMGTLIHEMSHFIVTANTNDYAYGQSACQSLASSSPQNAVNNADSHEYFAENNPKLSCNAPATTGKPTTRSPTQKPTTAGKPTTRSPTQKPTTAGKPTTRSPTRMPSLKPTQKPTPTPTEPPTPLYTPVPTLFPSYF